MKMDYLSNTVQNNKAYANKHQQEATTTLA